MRKRGFIAGVVAGLGLLACDPGVDAEQAAQHAWARSPLLDKHQTGPLGASGSDLGHGIPSSVHAEDATSSRASSKE